MALEKDCFVMDVIIKANTPNKVAVKLYSNIINSQIMIG